MAHDVFISHSAKDKATADAVCAMLETEGIRCWIAPRDVLPSMEWGEAIIDAIEQCRIMVLVFTANANDSPQIRREIERAVNRGVAILPLRVEDVLPGKALEYFIGNVHWLDALTPPFEAHLKSLAGTIKIVLARGVPGASPLAPQPVKPDSSGSHSAAQGTPKEAGGREKAPAPRWFWSTQQWTWTAGGVAALLLAAVFIGMHLNSHPAPEATPGSVTPPVQITPGPAGPSGISPVKPSVSPLPAPVPTPGVPKTPKSVAKTPEAPAVNSPSLGDTMRTLQGELSSIGSVSFTSHVQNKTDGSTLQNNLVGQVSNVVADPAQCRVSYHSKVWRNGVVVGEKDAWFILPAVTSVVVEPMNELLTEENAATGHPSAVSTSTTPPMVALVVRRANILNWFPFPNAALANRTAATVTQAVKLCGGHLAN